MSELEEECYQTMNKPLSSAATVSNCDFSVQELFILSLQEIKLVIFASPSPDLTAAALWCWMWLYPRMTTNHGATLLYTKRQRCWPVAEWSEHTIVSLFFWFFFSRFISQLCPLHAYCLGDVKVMRWMKGNDNLMTVYDNLDLLFITELTFTRVSAGIGILLLPFNASFSVT